MERAVRGERRPTGQPCVIWHWNRPRKGGKLGIEEEAGHRWLRLGIWALELLNDVDGRVVTIC